MVEMSNAQKLKQLREKRGSSLSMSDFTIYDPNETLKSYYENMISPEELEKAVLEYRDNMDMILKDFEEKTKLNKVDMGFLLTATALQCVRQYFLTPFRERVDDQSAANNTKGKDKEHSDRQHQYYRPSLGEVITNPVPFDAIQGSDGALKGSGMFGHRGATPGHDPILGYIFGTANIATATLTNYKMESFHIETGSNKRDQFGNRADTLKMFEKVAEKLQSDNPQYGRSVVGAAIIKEAIHLKSDIGSKKSLPVPVIATLNPELASNLGEYGIDSASVMDFTKQAALSILINTIISMLHGLYGSFWGNYSNENDIILHKVRTKKILMYSNFIASSSNLIYVAISGDLQRLDLGGLAVTLFRIFSDSNFIFKMKLEYLNNGLNKIYEDKIKEIEYLYT